MTQKPLKGLACHKTLAKNGMKCNKAQIILNKHSKKSNFPKIELQSLHFIKKFIKNDLSSHTLTLRVFIQIGNYFKHNV